ncbi:S1 family peptidase [Kribbella sancticallisti]|uniref:S1 family peptidase n=1 Tax=Kribbella sancticallisti TaxID=460087 RepID=A0ABN2CKF4_9ACTN
MHRRFVAGLGFATILIASLALAPAQARQTQNADPAKPTLIHGYDRSMLEALATSRNSTIEAAAAHLTAQSKAVSALRKLQASSPDVDGSYFVDSDEALRVNVSSAATAAKARAAGLVPRIAIRGLSDLDALSKQAAQLAEDAGVDDFRSTRLDVEAQEVVVTLGQSPGAKKLGLRLDKIPGVGVEYAAPGDKLPQPAATHIGGNGMEMSSDGVNGSGVCTQGFSGLRQGALMMLTVGHCFLGSGDYAYAGPPSTSTYLGRIIGNGYRYFAPKTAPAPDVALLALTASAGAYSSINTHVAEGYRPMATMQVPSKNLSVCKSGTRSGWSCGLVGDPAGSVEWANEHGASIGYVGPLWFADFCVVGGDSGGPIVAGNNAIGLVSAKYTNNCPVNSAWTHRIHNQTLFTALNVVLNSYPGTTTNF